MNYRLILLLAVFSMLGVRALGVHVHMVQQTMSQAAGMHLATIAEDADAGDAAAVDVVGSWLTSDSALALPAWAASGLVLLLAMLVAVSTLRLRRPTRERDAARACPYFLRPPSQAPPL